MQIRTVPVDSQDIPRVLEEASRSRTAPIAGKGSEEPTVRAFTPGAKKNINEEAGTIDFMITTPDVDAFGDIVVPAGMDNSRYRKNPVVQWNHDYHSVPIARSLGEDVQESGVMATAEFARDAMEFAAMVFRLYLGSFLNAVSIGFWPLKMTRREEENEDGTHKLIGFTFEEWKLLEFSAVPIPANENALVMGVSGICRVAKDLGMDMKEGNRIVQATTLIDRYPELLEKDGLMGVVRKAVREIVPATGDEDAEQRRMLKAEEALDVLREIKTALSSA